MARIGFVLPAHFSFSRSNGIREEALLKKAGLISLGHDVQLLSPWNVAEQESLDVIHFFYGGLPLANIADARLIRPRRLVFSTTIDSNQHTLAYRLAAAMGTFSDRMFTVQGEFQKQCRLADVVVVRSEHEKHRVIHGLGVAVSKVRVVHLGVDTNSVQKHRALGEKRSGIFHLSSYAEARKNVPRLIEAVGQLGLPLTIAGPCHPDFLPSILTVAQKYPNVVIKGFLTDLERDDLYYRSKVFALPSIHEGTGLSALEAAARGCEVVITRNGGPPDYFSGIGHLVDPLSVADIKSKIRVAYEKGSPEKMMAHIAQRFTINACAQQLEAAYDL